jgi:hypothetical protein
MIEKKKHKTIINSPPQFMLYALKEAILHPRRRISYLYCSECKIRIPASEQECPECHKKLGESPEVRAESPVPWWGSILCILIGIGAWIASACLEIPGLDEAARALVYIPLGSLFGMSLKRD